MVHTPRCLALSAWSAASSVMVVVLVLVFMIALLRSGRASSRRPWHGQCRICTAGGTASVLARSGLPSFTGPREVGHVDLRPVLPGGEGHGGARRAVDAARRPRAARRQHALQRAAARRTEDVARPAVEAAAHARARGG